MAKGKKAKKTKAGDGFPKKIAGIRVPKKVRKVAGGAVSFLDHPVVADIVAAALFTAASKLSEGPKAEKAARKAKTKAAKIAEVPEVLTGKPKRKKGAKKS